MFRCSVGGSRFRQDQKRGDPFGGLELGSLDAVVNRNTKRDQLWMNLSYKCTALCAHVILRSSDVNICPQTDHKETTLQSERNRINFELSCVVQEGQDGHTDDWMNTELQLSFHFSTKQETV